MTKQNKVTFIILVLSAVVIVIGALLLIPKDQPDGNKQAVKNQPVQASPTPVPQVGVQPDTGWQKVPEKERSSWLKDRLLELNHPGLQTMAEARLKALDEKAIPELLKLANDPRCGTAAIDWLQRISQQPSVKAALQAAMNGNDQQTKIAAFRTGASQPTEEFKTEFINALQNSKDEKLTDQLLLIAEKDTMKDKRIADVLLKMLPVYRDQSNFLIMALAGQGDERAVDPLVQKLEIMRRDMSNQELLPTRSYILRALGIIGGDKAMQTLLTIPPDENELLVMDSLNAFTELVHASPDRIKNLPPELKENLIKVFESDKKTVYGAANDALCAITGQKITISGEPSEQELKDLARKWREAINK